MSTSTHTLRLAESLNGLALGELARPVTVVFLNELNVEVGRGRGTWRPQSPRQVELTTSAPATAAAASVFSAMGPSFSAAGVPIARPGRSYAWGPVADLPPQVLAAGKMRAFTHTGAKFPPGVFRVDFDDDGDRGMATVGMYVLDGEGVPLLDPERNEAQAVVVRAWVQMADRDAPPPATPLATLYKGADGRIEWHAQDPLPDEAIRMMGGTVLEEIK